MSTFTQELMLPSRGLLNPEIPGGKVTQRCLMVKDQKYLAGSSTRNDQDKFNRMLQETVVSPSTFDVKKLTPIDALFLAFELRILSYGKSFKYSILCPKCGRRTQVTIDLTTVEVSDLEDDYEKDLVIELPNAGDTVYTKILTLQDVEEVTDRVKKLRRNTTSQEDAVGIEYEQRLVYMIKKIKLKEPNLDGDKELTDPIDLTKYVQELTDLDATAILSTVENIQYGVSPMVKTTCLECGREIDVPLRFNSDFFRPKYDNRSRESAR